MKRTFIRFFYDPLTETQKQTLLIEDLAAKMDTSVKEAAKAWAEVQALNKKFNDEVESRNTEGSKKGATLEQILTDVKELQAKAGRLAADVEMKNPATAFQQISKAFDSNFDKVKTGKFKFELEQKTVGTMTASSNLTTSTQVVLTYNLVPAVRGRQAVHMRDLVSTIPSATGVWQFYRQNTPAGEGSFGFQTTHGAAKNQLDYDLTAVTVNAEFLAGYSRIARQMLQDLPFLQTFVNNELIEDYLRRETFEFFDQMALGGGATGSSTTSASVTAEKIIDYMANLMQNNYQPSAIVTRPSVWASVLKTKPNDYSVPGGITISPTGDVMILGVPMVACTTNALPDNKVLVGDWSKAAIIQAEGLSVGVFEQDQDNVIKNLVTLRVESRVGFAILRPDAFVYANS